MRRRSLAQLRKDWAAGFASHVHGPENGENTHCLACHPPRPTLTADEILILKEVARQAGLAEAKKGRTK